MHAPRSFTTVSILLLALGVPAAASADPVSGVVARVETGKATYAPGEAVAIQVWVENRGSDPATLTFRDSRVADYSLDGEYLWSADKAFADVITQLPLAPGEERMLGEFRHRDADFALVPGVHAVTGSVVGYADATTRFTVADDDSGGGALVLHGEVSPNAPALGAPVEFRLTVTNTSPDKATYGVDGCPVLYSLDGVYRPQWACPEFWRQVELDPGESITYSPENEPGLRHDAFDYPLGPGPHTVRLEIPSIGSVEVPLTVGAPAPDRAYLAGRILEPNASASGAAALELIPASTMPADPATVGNTTYVVQAGPEGWFLFSSVEPGAYFLRARFGGLVLWYPGVADPDLAETLVLDPGSWQDDIRLPAPGNPGPFHVISGTVLESGFEGTEPLVGATIVALPVGRAWGDSTGFDGAGNAVPFGYVAKSGADGRYAIEVPFGRYRVLAGKAEAWRYRYWPDVERWSDAGIVEVWGLDKPATTAAEVACDFTLPRDISAAPGYILGTVSSDNPLFMGPIPPPLGGASVSAIPLLPFVNGWPSPVTSEADGSYRLIVRWDTPYFAHATAPGHNVQWYDRVESPALATGIDVAPREETSGIDFPLPPIIGPNPNGTIHGIVRVVGPNGDLAPLAGAHVVAVPASYAVDDTVVPPATDVAGGGETWMPPLWSFTTGPDGTFALNAPVGSYRLLAAKEGHRYRYWPDAERWADAEIVNVWSPDMDPPERYHELTLVPSSNDAAAIQGIVLDDNPLLGRPPAPIEGALVVAIPISPFGPEYPLSAITGPDGGYVVRVPSDAPYFVMARADGFIPEFHPGVPWVGDAEGVDVAPAATTGGINFGLAPVNNPPPVIALRGRVFEGGDAATVQPIPNAWVVAVPATPFFADSIPVPGDETGALPPDPAGDRYLGFTAEDGSFSIEVPSGYYRLIAGTRSGHRYQYWDHVDRWGDAGLVNADDFYLPPPGVPQPALNFHLEPGGFPEQATLSGRVLGFNPVTDGPPEPLAGAVVTAHPLGAQYERVILSTTTDENGYYELSVFSRGPYRVSAEAADYAPRFFPGRASLVEADGVDVVAGETTAGVDFTLQPRGGSDGGAIAGFVYEFVDDAVCADAGWCIAPVAGIRVRVEAAYPTFAPYVRETITDRSGHFVVDGLAATPGDGLPYYVSTARDGGEPVFYPGGVPFARAEPLLVHAGRTSDAGRLMLPAPSTNTGFVGGVIRDPDGNGIGNARVTLWLDPERADGPTRVGRTRADGSFSFAGIPSDARPIVSADHDAFVPAYYPGVLRWRNAQPVHPGGPAVDPMPVILVLRPAAPGGPFIQAGRVRVREDAIEPAAEALGDAARFRALQYHAANIPGAHFYLINSESLAPGEIPVAGGITGDNGTVVLTGLPAGIFLALADRPGFESGYFAVSPDASPIPIFLNGGTPAVLADIRLEPTGATAPGTDSRGGMVSDVLNAPNPFRPQTVIHFQLHADEPVTVQVFDFQGRLVRTLADGSPMVAGARTVAWDATDDTGRPVSAGIYFYRVQAGSQSVSSKMMLMPR